MSDAPKKRNEEIKYLVSVFDNNVDTELFKLISMSSICRIFDSNQLSDVIGGILSLYALMTGKVLEDETFQNSLLDEGLQLNAFKIQGKSDLSNCIKFNDPDLNAKFLHYLNSESSNDDKAPIPIRSVSYVFKQRFSTLNFPVGFIIAFTGLCLCLMSKKVTKFNHFTWVRQKWKSFLGILGLNGLSAECGPSHHLMPGFKVCRNVYSFFKLRHALRRRLYLGIMKLSWESGLWGNMCRALLRFSKGLEMYHIVLINTYILQYYPELIHVEELKPEFRKLQTAFQVFLNENIPEEQWPYVQIMDKSSNDILSKQNVPILNYLAVQIGKRIRKDLGDYHCKLSSEMQVVANKIISEIFNLDSTSQIKQALSENGSETAEAVEGNEFIELLKNSDILEKSLHRLSGVRSFNENDDGLILVPNNIPSVEVKYFQTSNNAEMLKVVCMLNICRIYQHECLPEVIGGILTLFAAFDSETLCSDECKISLRNHGFELCEIHIESANDLARLFVFDNKELNDLFMKFLGLECWYSNFHEIVIKNNPDVCNMFKNFFLKKIEMTNISVFIGLCLLPIFKQLDENNYTSWLEHKWMTFRRFINNTGAYVFPHQFSELLIPSQNTCCSIYSFFHSNFDLRRILFSKIVKLLKLSSPTCHLFSVICHNAKETEINHIYLINCHILQQRKHFLKMKELKPELLRFMHALEGIRSMLPPVGGWVYIKLFAHPNEVEFLNKNNFPLLLYLSESYHDSRDKPRYAGARTATEYFKNVVETAKLFSKFYNLSMTKKSIEKFFELKFPNGDLLSSIDDEQLRQLTINSMLLSTCHKQEFGNMSDQKKQEIVDMSIESVKREYKPFWKQYYPGMFKLMFTLTRPSSAIVTASNSSENELRYNSSNAEFRTNSADELQINTIEDALLRNTFRDEFQVSPIEDEFLINAVEDELQTNSYEDELLINTVEDEF